MEKVYYYIEKHNMINTNEKVIVGVSGGADSLCLLFVLLEYRKKVPFTLLVVHVEHGIRGEESLADASYVERICRENEIWFTCISCDVPRLAGEQKISVEEAARLARYQAFEKVKKEQQADKIAVAHNQNDQAETMLFRFARGTGIAGAGGIRPVNGCIIRPLLTCSRKEIEAYLQDRNICWREDASNADTEYTRNCLRHHVLPVLEREVNERTVMHLAALAEEMQQVQVYMEKQAKKQADQCVSQSGTGRWSLDIRAFEQAEPIMQSYLLREILRRTGHPMRDVSRVHIEAVRALAQGQSGRMTVLPGGTEVRREFGELLFAVDKEKQRLPEKTKTDVPIVIPGERKTSQGRFVFRVFPYENQIILQKRYTKWLDYDKINTDILLRTRRAGDFLTVNAQGGTKKLKRYFMEEKIPAGERENILLLAAGNEILWVVGYRINEAYKVTPQTKWILEIQRIGDCYGRENQCIDSGRGSGQTN